jgi:hypothetical protein
MEIRQLENQVRMLIELEETESPVVSCFFDSKDPDAPRKLHEQITTARKAIDVEQRPAFHRAVRRIQDHVPWQLDESTRSVAVFARTGSSPLFQVMEFGATLPTRLIVESVPAIFPLIELKDNFHRYVLMICTEQSARVLEVSLGSVTREIWAKRPELRERIGREWTKLRYQNHRRDRNARFVREKIALVERIIASKGHTHLMLAGPSHILARVRNGLPERLKEKLVDTIPAASRDSAADIVLATLSSFVEHEEQESLAVVNLLIRELRRGELAVCGYSECRSALLQGQADQLVILSDRDDAGSSLREELVRIAVQKDVPVEVVQESEALLQLGGVGCLLRYEPWSGADASSASDHAA